MDQQQNNGGGGVDQTYFVLKQAGELASRNPNTRINRPSALLPMPIPIGGGEMAGSGGAINRQPQRTNRRGQQQQQQSQQSQQQQYQHPTMMSSLLGAPASFYPSTSGKFLFK